MYYYINPTQLKNLCLFIPPLGAQVTLASHQVAGVCGRTIADKHNAKNNVSTFFVSLHSGNYGVYNLNNVIIM